MNIESVRVKIETPFNAMISLGDKERRLVDPPILQHQQNLSLVQIYCIALMHVKKKEFLTLNEILSAPQFRNFYEIQMFRELKDVVWNKKGERKNKLITLEEVLSLPSSRRITSPIQRGLNITQRERLLQKGMKIHKKHFLRFPNLENGVKRFEEVGNTLSAVVFELDHCDALRCEALLAPHLEVRRSHNKYKVWPRVSDKTRYLKFGWILFRKTPRICRIFELQSVVEDPYNEEFEGMNMFVAPTWTSFMLERLIQYYVLRGVVRFELPIIPPSTKTMISNYKEIPKAFGFSKQGQKWVLDFRA